MNLISLIHFISSFVCVLMSLLVYYRKPRDSAHKLFVLVGFLFGFVVFTQGCFHQAADLDEATFWWKCSSVWSLNLAVSYHFLALFTQQRRFVTVFKKVLVYVPASIITVIDLLTLYLSEVVTKSEVGWTIRFPLNPICVASQVWFVVMIFFVVLIPFRALTLTNTSNKGQLVLFLVGIAVASLTSVGDMWLTFFSMGVPAFPSILVVFPFLCLGLGVVIFEKSRGGGATLVGDPCRFCGALVVRVDSHEGICLRCLADRVGVLGDKVNHVIKIMDNTARY